jgi:hypothetical protein
VREVRSLEGAFWRDAGDRWRSGEPPSDWRQDSKGRWHPTQIPAKWRVSEQEMWRPPIGPAQGVAEDRHVGGEPPKVEPAAKRRRRGRG